MLGKIVSPFKWFGKKVGSGTVFVGKKIGRGAAYVVRRPELHLIASFLPIPYLKTAISLVTHLEAEVSGTERMRRAIDTLRKEPRFVNMKESELRWLIETALQVAEGRVTFQEEYYGDGGQ